MRSSSINNGIRSGAGLAFYRRLSRSHRFILIVFLIWLAQALPKWTVAITADGELSATIMRVFVTPRTDANAIGSAALERDRDRAVSSLSSHARG